jgi:hypothetical protein
MHVKEKMGRNGAERLVHALAARGMLFAQQQIISLQSETLPVMLLILTFLQETQRLLICSTYSKFSSFRTERTEGFFYIKVLMIGRVFPQGITEHDPMHLANDNANDWSLHIVE